MERSRLTLLIWQPAPEEVSECQAEPGQRKPRKGVDLQACLKPGDSKHPHPFADTAWLRCLLWS